MAVRHGSQFFVHRGKPSRTDKIMNEKRKLPLIEVIIIFAILITVGVLLAVKSRISTKGTEKKPEIEPTDAGTENNGKPTVDSVISEPISAPPKPEIHFPTILTDIIPLTKGVRQFPARNKRKRITRENMATIFRRGSRKLNLTTAVAELKGLGFGKTAAYEALLEDGRFSAWLQFAPDEIITWTD
jgi:hypothetical protein